jgi:hypothetical protein
VGRNRYSYSFNDPVNLSDPGGHAVIDRVWDRVFGEGSFGRTFGAGAYDRMDRLADRLFGSASDRAAAMDFGLATRQGAYRGTYTEFKASYLPVLREGTVTALRGAVYNKPLDMFFLRNRMLAEVPELRAALSQPEFFAFARRALMQSNYLAADINAMVEVSAYIYRNTRTGAYRYDLHSTHSGATFNRTVLPAPTPGRAETSISLHTHPATGIPYRSDGCRRCIGAGHPSAADIRAAAAHGVLGIVVTGRHDIWGYDGTGYW